MELTHFFLITLHILVSVALASPVAPMSRLNDHLAAIISAQRRDTQKADFAVIEEILDKIGFDYLDSKQVMTKQDVAKLSPEDAQLLSSELNKYLKNHDHADAMIPAFSNEDFQSELVLRAV